jgi:hypothetical protein
MKKMHLILLSLFVFALTSFNQITAQTATLPAGSGTEEAPYEIASLDNLYWVTQNTDSWNKYFIQTANIDATETNTWNIGDHDNDAVTEDVAMGFSPIGIDYTTNFSGSYNGSGYTINGLFNNRPATNKIGLFGYIDGSTINNLGLTNVDITGMNDIGGLVGYNYNNSTVTNSYSTGAVLGTKYVGGLVGHNYYHSTVSNSYSTGTVSGTSYIGGLVGYNYNNSTVSNSYSTGTITGTVSYVGGLMGKNDYNSTISNSYSTGTVSGTSYIGGLVGYNNYNSTVTNSFWDTQTSLQTTSAGGTGKITNEMQVIETFTNTETTGLDAAWDFIDETTNGTNDYWEMTTVNTYPVLSTPKTPPIGSGTVADPYQIATLEDLRVLSGNSNIWNKNFIQTANIDATGTNSWNSDTGFYPIGNNPYYFTGTYNGQSHTIDGLFISHSTPDAIGLFGQTYNSTINNIGLTNVHITGDGDVGGLVGHNKGTISNSYSTGEVSGETAVGGLIGDNENTIEYSFSTVTVTTTQQWGGGLVGYNIGTINNSYSEGTVGEIDINGQEIGGLVGDNSYGGIINNSYSTGAVLGDSDEKGGLAGHNDGTINYSYSAGTSNAYGLVEHYYSGVSNNSFWDIETSGDVSYGSEGTSKTTAEMQDIATFTNTATIGLDIAWDFIGTLNNDSGTNDYWDINEEINNGYPFLLDMPTPLNIVTWTGETNNSWTNSENWSGEEVPETGSLVSIPVSTNYPIISEQDINIGGLTIQNSAFFTIDSNGEFTIDGDLENNGTFNINSSASGEGSLLVNGNLSGTGTYNVERYLSGGQWHLVSSPITNGLSGVFNDIWLRPYDETANEFGEYIVPTTTQMPSGQGFSVWTSSTQTRTFSGIINNGNIGPLNAQLSGTAGENTGWNLMGNPYPSAIDWDATSGWTKTNLNNAVYVWNNSQYETYVGGVNSATGGGRYIAPGQGFFVHASSSGASLSMNNDVRVHNSVNFMKSTNTDPENIIRIKVTGNGYSDEAVIAIRESDSFTFDQTIDAYKLTGSSDAPQMHIQKDDMSNLSIASFSNIENIENKAIYINYAQEGEHIISWTNTISENVIPNLTDQITGQTIPSGTNYSFTASNSDMQERFIFSTDPLNIQENIMNIAVWEYNNILYVNNHSNTINKVSIFNIQGVKVMENTGTRFDLNSLTPAMYVVKVQSGSKTQIEKIIVK